MANMRKIQKTITFILALAVPRTVALDDNTNTQYLAPYHQSEHSNMPNRYAVAFSSGHTFEKHSEAMGEQLDVFYQARFYSATLTEEQRERIRSDPGEERVVQYVDGEWA